MAIVFLSCCISKIADAGDANPDVLILNSYHQGEEWSDNELAGILSTLKDAYPFLVPAIEHLDAKRFPAPAHLAFFEQYLKTKYQARRFDLIMVLDNSALDLMLRFRKELLPGVPIVFAGVNGYRPNMIQGRERITGVAEVQDVAGTLNLVLTLQPSIKNVLAVHDYTSSGMAVHRDMESAAAHFKGKVVIEDTPEGTVEDLVAQLKALPRDTVVMLLTYVTDKNGRTLTREESTRLITAASPVPVYAMHETRLGHGIVGGMLLEGREHGRQAAEMALKVLAGQDASGIPVENSRSRPVLDYQVLTRFKIPEKRWPAQAIIINRPVSFWRQNRSVLIPALSIIGILFVSTALLITVLLRMRTVENALRESEAKYRRLFEQMSQGAFRQRADGSLIDVNPAALNMFGLTKEEFLGRSSATPSWDVIAEDGSTLSPHEHPSMVALNTGKPVSDFVLGVWNEKNGTRVWMEVNAIPEFRSGEEKPYQVMVTVHDLTDYKKAQAELRASEDRFRSFAEQSLVGIYLIADETFKYVNPKFAEIFGYRVDECLDGIPFSKLVHPADLDQVKAMVQKRVSGELSRVQHSFRGIRKNGEIIHVEVFGSTVVLKGEAFAVGTMLDVTERKKFEDALKRSLKEKEILLQEINHRVKNNMQVIISMLKLQADRIRDEQFREIFLESQNRIFAMSAVHQTLHQSEDLDMVELGQYISLLSHSVYQSYRTDEGNVELLEDISPIEVSLEHAYPIGLILNELLTNALKYAFPKSRPGKIVITGKLLANDALRLTVSDNGVGFPPGMNWKDADSLGLQIVKTLVEEQLEGTVSLDNSSGTRWEITFPL